MGKSNKEGYSFSFSSKTGKPYLRNVPKLAQKYNEMSGNEFINFCKTDHIVSS